MSDSPVVNPRISFDPEEVRSITIPTSLPAEIKQEEQMLDVGNPTPAEPIPVPSESGIAVPDKNPIETYNPDDQIQITIPTEMPLYTVKERLDDELSPGPVNDSVLQQGEPLLNPLLPGDNSGKVSYQGEPPQYLGFHLSQDFIRPVDRIFIRREPLTASGDYHFVITDSEKAGRLGFIKASVGSRNALVITGATVTQSVESDNYSATEGFGLIKESTFYNLTIDQIYARRFIRSVWDECNRIRSTRGTLFASASSPIIAVTTNGGDVNLAFTEAISFGVDDLIMVRKIVEGTLREAIFQVKSITPATNMVTATLTSGTAFDYLGCVAARIGNVSSQASSGSLRMSDDDPNTPFIEAKDGVQTVAQYSDILKVMARVGNLNGITDPVLGNLTGYGIFARRLFGYGTVILAQESRLYYGDNVFITANSIVDYFTQNDADIDSISLALQQINQFLQSIPNDYYTKIQLQTSGQAQVHWDNISGKPTQQDLFKHTHPIVEVTQLPEELDYIKTTYCTKQQSIINSIIYSIALG